VNDQKEVIFNTSREKIISQTPLIIDLASGVKADRKKQQGRITTDQHDLPNIDIVCDLNNGLPFLDSETVDEIYSGNSLEHIDNLFFLMDEIHRVLKRNGKKHLVVPHFSNPHFYSDPTHKRFFGLYSFFYFSDDQEDLYRKVPDYYFEKKFYVTYVKLRFSSPFPWVNRIGKAVSWLVNRSRKSQEVYEACFCYLFPCYGIEVVLVPKK